MRSKYSKDGKGQDPQKQQDLVARETLIKDFVFHLHPRVLPFSHRPLISLRHPRVCWVCWDDENRRSSGKAASKPTGTNRNPNISHRVAKPNAPSARSKKPGIPSPNREIERAMQKLELLQLSSLQETFRENESFVWDQVTSAHDLIVNESEIETRRNALLCAPLIMKVLENWWSFFCPTPHARYMSRKTYADLQRSLFYTLLRVPIAPLQDAAEPSIAETYDILVDDILEKLTQNDYLVDRMATQVAQGTETNSVVRKEYEGIDFAAFSYSLLELVDTWHPSVEVDSIGAYLKNLFHQVTLWFEAPSKPNTVRDGAHVGLTACDSTFGECSAEALLTSYQKRIKCSTLKGQSDHACHGFSKCLFLVARTRDAETGEMIYHKET